MARPRISLDEAAKLYLGSIRNLTFLEYRIKKNQIKSVIQRAINSGQIQTTEDGKIDFSSFSQWLNTGKVQAAFYIRADVLERFKEANRGKNLSYQVQELMARSIDEY